ncbi:MAG: ion transporter [Candidatus Omnitrophica bacterium]|nr:ion transporter [Candidatus Omnitrophota bacterium]
MSKTALKKIRYNLRRVIFDSDTAIGKTYDILLIVIIAVSVLVVLLESVSSIGASYGKLLKSIEWGFTFIFTIDYFARIWAVEIRKRYLFSFFGIVDLLGVIPTYLSFVFPSTRYLVTIRFLRVLRIFRVLKLVAYMEEARILSKALYNSWRKIVVFLFTVFALVVVLGALMYVIESPNAGFTSVPRSIYWAVVTLTTVGYGDISPITPLGQSLAALIMVLGYSIIAVPTGIVTVGLSKVSGKKMFVCPNCLKEGHDRDALYCKYCGNKL